ncbi:Uncharacterised protein r2_g1631 [Pycnogonum litorale]
MANVEEVYVIKLRPSRSPSSPSPPDDTTYRFPADIGLGLGVLHFILGLLSIILETVGLFVVVDRTKTGAGIWSGAVFVMTGASCMFAWKYWYQKRKIGGLFVMSIFSIVCSTMLLVITSISIAEAHSYYDSQLGLRISGNVIVVSVLELILSVVSAFVAGGGLFKCMRDVAMINNRAPKTKERVVISTNVIPQNLIDNQYSNVVPIGRSSRRGNGAQDFCNVPCTLTLPRNPSKFHHRTSHSDDRIQTFVSQAQQMVAQSRSTILRRDVPSSDDNFSTESFDSESGYDA